MSRVRLLLPLLCCCCLLVVLYASCLRSLPPAEGLQCTKSADCWGGTTCQNQRCRRLQEAPGEGAQQPEDAGPPPEPPPPEPPRPEESPVEVPGVEQEKESPPEAPGPEPPGPEPPPVDQNCTPQQEVCDGKDNNCDGTIDEGCPLCTSFRQSASSSVRDVPYSLAIAADGSKAASASGQEVIIWSISTTGLAAQRNLQGHSNKVLALAFRPDGKMLASASADKSIILWDPNTGTALHKAASFKNGHTDEVLALAFHPDGKMLASASKDKSVKLWDVSASPTLRTLLPHDASVRGLSFSHDGKYIVAATENFTHVYDVDSPSKSWKITGKNQVIQDAVFAPKTLLLAIADDQKEIRIWDLSRGFPFKLLRTFSDNTIPQRLAFGADARLLFSALTDGTVSQWDVNAGNPSTSNLIHNSKGSVIHSVATSRDGTKLISVGADKKVILWECKAP